MINLLKRLRPSNQTIINDFINAGFTTQLFVLNTKDFGLPQNRKRIFFMGINNTYKSIQKELFGIMTSLYFPMESDKYMIEDYPTTKKAEWKTYRQSLRDMDFYDPDNITWPTKPE